jgi:hypothetical protein
MNAETQSQKRKFLLTDLLLSFLVLLSLAIMSMYYVATHGTLSPAVGFVLGASPPLGATAFLLLMMVARGVL